MDGEKWLPIAGYDGRYEVSSFGRVRSNARRGSRILRHDECAGKSPRVTLSRGNALTRLVVSECVMSAFSGVRPRPSDQVVHADGNLGNCRIENLSWGDRAPQKSEKVSRANGRRFHRARAVRAMCWWLIYSKMPPLIAGVMCLQRPARRGSLKHRLKKYALSLDDYEAMRRAQSDLCGICGRPETRRATHRGGIGFGFTSLSIDHDHSTGAVRGLLCSSCNVMLGRIEQWRASGLMDLADVYLARSVAASEGVHTRTSPTVVTATPSGSSPRRGCELATNSSVSECKASMTEAFRETR